MLESIRRLLVPRPPVAPRVVDRAVKSVPKPAPSGLPTRPVSRPSTPEDPLGRFAYGGFVPHRYQEPSGLYTLFRLLRDAVPDISAGVWAWVRLCATPQTVRYEGGGEEALAEARGLIEALDAGLFEFDHMKRQGMDALVNSFFLSVFTYGAFAGEIVLKEDLSGIDRFYIIDPATIRFRRFPTSRRLTPYQVTADGEIRRLRSASFFYYALDADNDNPYGRSPLLSLPLVVRIQQQLISDMAKASHNFGHPTLHVTYRPQERAAGESPSDYQNRIQSNFDQVVEGLRDREPDSNFITFDNIDIQVLSPGGQSVSWTESLQAISEQVVAGLHLAPFMIGRNWGSTESWGAAQHDLLTSNAVSVQRGAKRMAEWIRNLELALRGSPVTTRHEFAPHSRMDVLDRARAQAARAETALKLYEQGFLDKSDVRQWTGI